MDLAGGGRAGREDYLQRLQQLIWPSTPKINARMVFEFALSHG